MRHTISIAAVALAAVVAGCNRPGSDQQSANTVTVAGCVQSAEQGLAAPSSDSKPDRFMLTNASLSPSGAASSTASDAAKSDPAAAPRITPPGTMYMLDGKTDELREHLNKQVEITGRLDNAAADAPAAPAPRQELHVDSVRAIAATCVQ
jgi:hypothetical protein